jgi:hypothetical protein
MGINQLNHKDKLYCRQVSFTMPQWTPSREYHNVFSGFSTYFFDAIPTGRVSKHYSVGLILVQRRSSDTVAAQRRCIPKCTFFLPRGDKLVWQIFFLHFISRNFYRQIFAPSGLQKTDTAF